MEEHQEQKQHVCKFCKKRFPCGRSLGGHMRSHMSSNNSSSAEAAKEKKLLLDKNKKQSSSVFNGGSSSNNNTDIEGGGGGHGGVGYTLRENPKKTWRLSDSIDGSLTQEKVCKECGKAFQSWKALFGHMRCHSEKEREREREKERVLSADSLGEEEDSWVDENQKLVMDNQSDNEAAAPKRRRRRSRRMRYKNTTTTTNGTTTTTTNANTVTATTTTTTSSSFSFANGSTTCVSEIEQEQEEVAMCLMMLSRDVGCWGGLNSVVESSDNNSVVLEVRSSSLVKEIAEKDDCNAGQCVTEEKLRDNKLKSVVLESDIVRFEKNRSELGKSSFGVLRNGFKKVESEVSVAGSIGADRFEKANEVGFELGRGVAKCTEAEMGKDLIKEANDQADSEGGKHNLSKRAKCDAFDPEMGTGSSKKTRYDASECEVGKDSPNKNKFECTTCNKTFHSYQALGGHRASHKRVKGCFASKIETSENSIETDITPEPALDSKLMKLCSNRSPNGTTETSYRAKNGKHECPICFKVFASGQALGGHKRSHVVEVSEARSNQAIVIQQKLPEIRDLLDLNLPAPVEEDSTNAHIGFKPWWVGTNHKHEPPMGLISN